MRRSRFTQEQIIGSHAEERADEAPWPPQSSWNASRTVALFQSLNVVPFSHQPSGQHEGDLTAHGPDEDCLCECTILALAQIEVSSMMKHPLG